MIRLAKTMLVMTAAMILGVVITGCSHSPPHATTSPTIGKVEKSSTTTTTTPVTTTTVTTSRHWGTPTSDINNVETELSSPTAVVLPGKVVEVASSNSTEYALLANGTVFAWGLGGDGELGDGKTVDSLSTPVQVAFPPGVTIAELPTDAMPYDTGMAIDTDGNPWGWGLNKGGELCLGNSLEQLTPVRLPLTHVTAMAGAGVHAIYDSNGTVYGCGAKSHGELGDGQLRGVTTTPVVVENLPVGEVRFLVASWSNSGALLENGTYLDWGYNSGGQLGNGAIGVDSAVPVTVPLPLGVTQVALGGSSGTNGQTLVMLSNGSLRAWGDDQYGQLGDAGTGMHPSPVAFTPPDHVTYRLLATGGETSYAVSTSGDVYSWGAGVAGQIGNGQDNVAQLTPVLVVSGVSHISATAFNVVSN